MKGWNQMGGKMQKPMQDLVDLNLKTFKQLKFIKTEDLTDLKHPEELLSKNINLMIENGHKVLTCLEESFHILEEAFLNFSKDIKESTEKGLQEARVDIFKNKFLNKEELFKPVVPDVKTDVKMTSKSGKETLSGKANIKTETKIKASKPSTKAKPTKKK